MPDNNLHGNVPKSLALLPELRQLWLQGNPETNPNSLTLIIIMNTRE